jgi:hypothetical protein
MRPYHDPASRTPEERFGELASLLATGLLRLHARPTYPADLGEHPGSKKPPESSPNGLALPNETVLSVHTG